jgi:1-deoxy-D-xylulose-5-phosphate reductoisomerase
VAEDPIRRIAILGSTGSIGRQSLDLIRSGMGDFRIVALAAGKNVDLLAEQAREFRPDLVAIGDPKLAGPLRDRIGGRKPRVVAGQEGLREAATFPGADMVVAAIVGAAGLESTFAAVAAGKPVALANKESLVMAGALMMSMARRTGAELLPVDSEHSALHQCLRGESHGEVRRLILTASGGPFLRATANEMEQVSPETALRHPTWRMGPKITIDSATLMNKGLEVIEAHWLFGVDEDKIDILIHPQSLVHSLVEFVDGSLMAQIGATDMRLPIHYALCHPDRLPNRLDRLRLEDMPPLEFISPDPDRFPAPGLARAAVRTGGTAPAVLNAANEEAVAGFLNGRIGFTAIPRVVETALERHQARPVAALDEVLEADRDARRVARDFLKTIR